MYELLSNPIIQAAVVAVLAWVSWKNKQRIAGWLHSDPTPQVRDFIKEITEAKQSAAVRVTAAAPAARPTLPGPVPSIFQPFDLGSQQGAFQSVKLSTVAMADNILVVGQKGAGKTTLLLKVLATRVGQDDMVALDPHATPGKWPCATVGAGRDYAIIGRALTKVEANMDERFKQLGRGEVAEGGFSRRSVVTDEYRSIADKLNGRNGIVDAGALLLSRISEGRKVGECALVACHNDTGEALGITGNTDMKTCFDYIIYMGGLVDSQRTQKCPPDIKVEALKRHRPAVAWLTEKNQWFVLDDDLPMPVVSSVAQVVPSGSQEPVPANVAESASSGLGDQYGTSTEPVPTLDGIDADAIKALHNAGWSNNKIADRMKGRREDRLDRIRKAVSEVVEAV